MKRHAASTRQWVGDVGAKACPPLCIAAGYSPDKGKIEFASLAKIKTALDNTTNFDNIQSEVTPAKHLLENFRLCKIKRDANA